MGLTFEHIAAKHIGTSKSGIRVQQQIKPDGTSRLTSFKKGKIFKEVTQMPIKSIGGIDTFVNNYKTGESTVITKFIDRETGKIKSIYSYSRSLGDPLYDNKIIRFMQQSFKNGKLFESASGFKK